MSIDKEKLVKKIIYLTKTRGYRENNILLQSITYDFLYNLQIDQIIECHKFLSEDDASIFDWITRKKPLPDIYDNELIHRLISDIK